MLKLVSSEQMQTIINEKEVDFDRYNIEIESQISTKQYSVVVDFKREEISGDCVAFGSWFDIESKECIELLEEVSKDHKPIRDFSNIIEKQIEKIS